MESEVTSSAAISPPQTQDRRQRGERRTKLATFFTVLGTLYLFLQVLGIPESHRETILENFLAYPSPRTLSNASAFLLGYSFLAVIAFCLAASALLTPKRTKAVMLLFASSFLILLTSIFCFAKPSNASPVQYHLIQEGASILDDSEGISASIPAGWIPVPDEVVSEYNAYLGALAPKVSKAPVEWAFQPADAPRWLIKHPYIMVQRVTTGFVPKKMLVGKDSVISQELEKVVQSFPAKIDSTNVLKEYYDAELDAVWSPLVSDIEGVGLTLGISTMLRTDYGFLQVTSYASAAEWQNYANLFYSFARSIQRRMPRDH